MIFLFHGCDMLVPMRVPWVYPVKTVGDVFKPNAFKLSWEFHFLITPKFSGLNNKNPSNNNISLGRPPMFNTLQKVPNLRCSCGGWDDVLGGATTSTPILEMTKTGMGFGLSNLQGNAKAKQLFHCDKAASAKPHSFCKRLATWVAFGMTKVASVLDAQTSSNAKLSSVESYGQTFPDAKRRMCHEDDDEELVSESSSCFSADALGSWKHLEHCCTPSGTSVRIW